MKHPEAFWSAVLVFCTNLAAIEVVRFLGDDNATVLIATVFTSMLAAVAIYAKTRLAEIKKAQNTSTDKEVGG